MDKNERTHLTYYIRIPLKIYMRQCNVSYKVVYA